MFRFRLQRILDYRQTQVDSLRGRLARALQRERDAASVHEAVRRQRAEAETRHRTGGELPLRPLQLRARLASTRALIAAQSEAMTRLSLARDEVRTLREHVIEAHRRVRMLEKLRERRRLEHEAQIFAQERKELDDIGGRGPRLCARGPATTARPRR